MTGIVLEEEKLKKPWKFEGYPGFSKWMASSEDFLIFRRFNDLNVRAMLLMQDRIARKEEELEKIDEDARMGPDDLGDSSSLRNEPQKDREKILDGLIPMLQKYNEYMLSFSQIRTRRSAQEYQIGNVEAWFWNHPAAIVKEEQGYVRKAGDVVALVARVKSPLRLLLEKFSSVLTCSLFRAKKRKDQIQSPTTSYYSNTKFDAFVTTVLIFSGILLLLGPMWTLQYMTNNTKRLGVITAFILLFTSLLASATVAKPFEVLAATAAYSAVLMVFLQIGN